MAIIGKGHNMAKLSEGIILGNKNAKPTANKTSQFDLRKLCFEPVYTAKPIKNIGQLIIQ